MKDDKLNIFRLPVGWQYLTGNNLGGGLNSANLQKYDQLVQACLNTGATCIIDVHNYARWNGQIIGQGGPSNDQFVNLWTQIATKYKGQTKIAFGVMNEPHEVDINKVCEIPQHVFPDPNVGEFWFPFLNDSESPRHSKMALDLEKTLDIS